MTVTVTEHIRQSVLKTLGWVEETVRVPPLPELQATEWSDKFERYMRNRMIMGSLRYGTFAEKSHNIHKYKLVETAREKLRLYEETGNDELLVDVANYMLLEFEFGLHPGKHFSATDDEGHCLEKGVKGNDCIHR